MANCVLTGFRAGGRLPASSSIGISGITLRPSHLSQQPFPQPGPFSPSRPRLALPIRLLSSPIFSSLEWLSAAQAAPVTCLLSARPVPAGSPNHLFPSCRLYATTLFRLHLLLCDPRPFHHPLASRTSFLLALSSPRPSRRFYSRSCYTSSRIRVSYTASRTRNNVRVPGNLPSP